MKSSLQSIQTDFQDYILAPDSGTPAIAGAITGQFGLNVNDRLAIYHNAYRARLREALSEAYEKTHSYLGDDLFAQMCDDYIQETPSGSPNLRWYGDGFSAFLVQALDDHPCVAELASFEWALGRAFDAGDSSLLTTDALRIPTPEQWEQISFALHPSVQLLSLQWNVIPLWLALDQEQIPPEAVASPEPATWLVWRKQLQPHFRSLDRFESIALTGLQQGQSFSSVCGQAAEGADDHDITPKIAGWLQNWLNDTMLTQILW